MDFLIILLIAIYLLSPIPLLILFILARKKVSGVKTQMELQERDFQRKENKYRQSEESYRQYVQQLQNQVRSLDPDAKLGYIIKEKEIREETKGKPAPAFSFAAMKDRDEHPAASENTALPVQEEQKTADPSSVVAEPLLTPESVYQTSGLSNAETASKAQPQPQPQPVPQPQYEASPEVRKESATTNLILVIGVLFLILASVGFISATWSQLGIGVRALCLFSFSAIFLGAGILARVKFRLPSTGLAFYSIGSAALPITILGASAFELFGDHFGLHPPEIYNTQLLAFSSLMLLMLAGCVIFKSRVFAAISLTCVSLDMFTLALMYDYPYSLNVLLIALFAAGCIFLSPYVKKIGEGSVLFPYSKVFEVYSIINLYFMTVVALSVSHRNMWSGISLILLGTVFFTSSVLKRKTGLLGLPMIILIPVGLAQILKLDSSMTIIIWLTAVGITFHALALVPGTKKVFSKVLFWCGMAGLLLTTYPLLDYALSKPGWVFAPLCAVIVSVYIFLSEKYKRPIIFSAAMLPAFSLLFGTAVRIIAMVADHPEGYSHYYSRLGDYSIATFHFYVAGFIIAAVMYFIFSYIPHHKYFTSTGNIILFFLMFRYGAGIVDEVFDRVLWVQYAFVAGMLLLCLITSLRTDLLNVRKKDVEVIPRSICANRCFYGVIWPVFFLMAPKLYGRYEPIGSGITLLVIIGLCFCFIMYRVFRMGTPAWSTGEDDLSSPRSSRRQAPRALALYSGSVAMVLTCCTACFGAEKELIRTAPFVYVLMHLAIFLIPAVLILMAVRDVWVRKDQVKDAKYITGLTLAGLITFSLTLPAALDMLFYFDIRSFYLKPVFILSVLALLILLLAGVYTRKGKEGSALLLGAFYYAAGISVITCLYRFASPEKGSVPAIPLILAAMVLVYCYLYREKFTFIQGVAAFILTWNHVALMRYYLKDAAELPIGIQILIYLIPIAVLSCVLAVRKKKPVTGDPLFWGTLVSQSSLFIAVPYMTKEACRILDKDMPNVSEYVHSSHSIDQLLRTGSSSIFRCHYAWIMLMGFVMIELFLLFTSEGKKEKKRALALIAVTLSNIVWMPVMGFPALCYIFEHLYLLPPGVFCLFLNWIFPNENGDSEVIKEPREAVFTARLVYACLSMGVMAWIAIICNDLFSLLVFGISGVAVLVFGYIMKKKPYTILGAVCMLGMLAYIANRVWGSMAWLIYLFATGAFLVSIAVRNEIKKRKQNQTSGRE